MPNSQMCRIDECTRPARTRELCEGHYKRLLKYGSAEALAPLAPRGLTRDELFIRRIDRSDFEGCWRWLGKVNMRGQGYGDFTFRDGAGRPTTIAAHRYAYELWIGPIPVGLTIDHVYERGCRHTDCVNPAHLEAVTPAEQNRRYYSRQTHCKRGHEFTPENTRWGGPNGRTRFCRECGRRRTREHWKRTYVPHPVPLKTHCKNGHEFTPENTRMGGKLGTTRLCKQCARDVARRSAERRKQQTQPPSV